MTRKHATTPHPHRDLLRLDRDVQRGADVRLLEGKARLRLEARDVNARRIGRDGILTADEFDAFITAARLLGVSEETLQRKDQRGRRILTIGAQRVIVEPESRTPEQLARAGQAMARLIRERELRDRGRDDDGGVSGLSRAKRTEARERAVAAMRLLLANEPRVHYTQGPARWDGIRLGLRSAAGRYPRYADCSSSTTWALWNALTAVGGTAFSDIVNGQRWLAGYTGTQLAHGRAVDIRDGSGRLVLDRLLPGDLVFYGRPGSTGDHVVMYVGGGKAISHGSEAGPFLVSVGYRGDVMAARRYI